MVDMTNKDRAEQFAHQLVADGIAIMDDDTNASLRASIGKAVGAGVYSSFYVSGLGLVYVMHDWVRKNFG